MIDEDYKILPLSVPAREKVYREYWVQLGVDRQPGDGGESLYLQTVVEEVEWLVTGLTDPVLTGGEDCATESYREHMLLLEWDRPDSCHLHTTPPHGDFNETDLPRQQSHLQHVLSTQIAEQ